MKNIVEVKNLSINFKVRDGSFSAVKDISFNFKDMVATKTLQTNGNVTGGGSGYLTGGVRGMTGQYPSQSGTRFTLDQSDIAVNA